MRKQIVIGLCDALIIVSLALVGSTLMTGGFAISWGFLTINAHNLKNPLILLASLLLIRRLATGSFFRTSLSEQLVRRAWLSPALRIWGGIGLGLLALLSSAILMINPLQTGLTGIYYETPDWSGTPLRSAHDAVFNLEQMYQEFPRLDDDYSIEWRGRLFIPRRGVYQFRTISDDGSELWIGDHMVVDNRGLHPVQEKSGDIRLEAGWHPIRIRYMQATDSTNLQVFWKPPRQSWTLLSSALTLPDAPVNARYVQWYLIRRTAIGGLGVVWGLVVSLLVLGAIPRTFAHWSARGVFTRFGFKLFLFWVLTSVALNALVFWGSARIPSKRPVVSTLNMGWYGTYFFLTSPAHDRLDSWLYLYRAVHYMSEPHETPLYTELCVNQRMKFQYPPTSLLLIEPFKGLALEQFIRTANVMSWCAILCSMIGLVALFRLSCRAYLLPQQALPPSWAQILLAGCFTLTFYPLMSSFRVGQIQSWIYGFFMLALLAWMSNRKGLSGGLIGIICIIKPQLGLLVAWGAWRKQWRFVLGILGVVSIFGAISLWRYGLISYLDYLPFFSFMAKHGESYYQNQSVNGLLNRFLFNGPNLDSINNDYPPYHPWIYIGTLITSALIIGLAIFWKRRRSSQVDALDLAIAALSFTIASPIAWAHHYAILLPLFVIALPAAWTMGARRINLIVLAVVFTLCSNFLHIVNHLADTRWNVMQSHLLFGALGFLGYLYWLRDARRL